ncbi:MAG TPA: hypothetical protein VH208_12745, partial [Myxococcaceae bacterium]|nr:hypothetical protein [Myxococcaceae bacterium]
MTGPAHPQAPLPRDPSQKFWDPDWQTADEEKRRALQDQRTRELVQRIFDSPVPFFVKKLEAAGVKHAADIKGVADLERIPLTVKSEL